MNTFKRFTAFAAFALIMLSLPAIASAQWRNDDDDDRNRRNGGYNNGQYGNRGDMRSTIRGLKSKAKDFQRQIDRDLDDDRRYNGRRRDDQMNDLAKRFKDAVNKLDNNGYYNNSQSRYSNNGDRELQRVFDAASQIDRTIGRSRVGYHSQNLWSGIRYDLQVLSRATGYDNNGRGRGNNGGWGNGRSNGGRNRMPGWWPF